MGQWRHEHAGPWRPRPALFPTLPKGEVARHLRDLRRGAGGGRRARQGRLPGRSKSRIVGNDLKSVERVTGKLTWGRAALAGAASGAWLGMFFGLLLIFFSPAVSLGFVLAARADRCRLRDAVRHRHVRDQPPPPRLHLHMQVIATSYSVLVDPELGNRARNLLESGGAAEARRRPRMRRRPPSRSIPPTRPRLRRPATATLRLRPHNAARGR